jgi:hypothetical protein
MSYQTGSSQQTLVVAGAAIAAGQAFMVQGTFAILASPANLALQTEIGGIALTGGVAGQTIDVLYRGALPPAIAGVGAGLATAVGLNATAHIVRVTDATITSVGAQHKLIGYCDAAGNILISPFTTTVFDALDYGLDNTGTVFNDAAHAAFIASIALTTEVQTAYYPSGIYKFNVTIGPWPYGTHITGDGAGGEFGVQGTELRAFGPGIFVELGHNNAQNQNNPTIFEKFNVQGHLNTGHANAPNINQVGIDILGDVGVTVQDCNVGGFQIQLNFDGAELCHAYRMRFDYSGTGYTDMLTNLGDESARAIQFGTLNFTVGASCNGCSAEDTYFNNSFFCAAFTDGDSNYLSRFGTECPCWAWIQGGGGYAIEKGEGENGAPFANIWIHSSGVGPGAVENLAIRDCEFMQGVPAILFDPAHPSSIFGLDFPNNNCQFMTVFPITNAEPNISAINCPPSTLLPAAGVALGALTDSQENAFTGIVGTILNDTTKAQAALDVVIIQYATPGLRVRAGPFLDNLVYHELGMPATKFGSQETDSRQLWTTAGTTASSQEVDAIGATIALAGGGGAVDAASITPPADGSFLVTLTVVAKHTADKTHPAIWKIHQMAYVSAGVLTFPVAPVTEYSDTTLDANYVAPTIGGAAGPAFLAVINANTVTECSFSVTLDYLFIGDT